MIAGLALPSLVRLAREAQAPVGAPAPIVVSGILASELAAALGTGGPAGLVRTGDAPAASAFVRIIAGEPTSGDLLLLRAARRRGVPTVVVRTGGAAEPVPYVPATEVVDVAAGHGFPVAEVVAAVVSAVGDASAPLGAALPAFRDQVRRSVVRRSAIRAAAIAGLPTVRQPHLPLISAAQTRMLVDLRRLAGGAPTGQSASPASIAPMLVAPIAAGLASRAFVRTVRAPAPLRAAVAAGVSVALATLAGRVPAS